MAKSYANADAIGEKWRKEVYMYRKNAQPFGKFEGASRNLPIVHFGERIKDARSMNYTLIEEVRKRGKGRERMVGREAVLPNKTTSIYPCVHQEAIAVDFFDAHEATFDPYRYQMPALRKWAKNMDMWRIIDALWSVENSTANWEADETRKTNRPVTFYNADAAQKDAFLASNYDRLLFGAAQYTPSDGTSFDAALATIAAANVMSAAVVRAAVSLAEAEDKENGIYCIEPVAYKGYDQEHYVMFHEPAAFANLKADPEVQRFAQEATSKMGQESIPYFVGGSFVFEKCLHVRVPQMVPYVGKNLTTAGAADAALTGSVLCGSSAVVKAIGQVAKATRRSEDDYEQWRGVGIRFIDTYEKPFFQNRQWGCVNIFTAVDAQFTPASPANPISPAARASQYNDVTLEGTAPSDLSLAEGATASNTVDFSGAFGGDVTLSASGLESWMSFDAETGVLTALPLVGDAGAYTVTVTATNDNGDSGSVSITVTVTS